MVYNAEVNRKTLSFGQDFDNLADAVDYANSGLSGKVTLSDGVFVQAFWYFRNGTLTRAGVNTGDRLDIICEDKP
ncbi:hypothetical protein OAF54_00620 [bacterium]|nr:hypothetical protein [bacterium]